MKIGIIGQGYVGLTLSKHAAKHHQVVGFDLNRRTVGQLNQGISHIEGVESSSLKDLIK